MSADVIAPELVRVGPFHLGDVLRNGLRECGANEARGAEMIDAWLEQLRSLTDDATPDPYAQPDAMVYLPARAFAALSNALALMVRHAIDDRETLGQLAEARNGDAERLALIEHELGEGQGRIAELARNAAADQLEAKLLRARLEALEAKPVKPRARKAA
jgi:hypothetical protein